ncbi:MAG TPA: tetratricopeptide repeat protein, partial [Isosphaeraceae bacterium]
RARRLLAETYRQERDFAKAEALVRDLLKEEPKDARLADTLVQLVAAQAGAAADRNDRRAEQELNGKAATLIRQFQGQFPNDLAFLQDECELAVRLGDYTKAESIAREMDKKDKNSTAGPLMRARLYAAQGWTERAAQAYAESLARNPRRADVRLLLGQSLLETGRPEEALQQADRLLEGAPDEPAALLLKAKALAALDGPADRRAARRDQAIALLRGAIAKRPAFVEAHHLIAATELAGGRRAEAIAALKAGLKAVPGDVAGLSLLVQYLTEPRDGGRAPSPAEMGEAKALAESFGGPDTKGDLCLALAVGFHKAGQLELALPWAEKAATQLDAPVVHLDFGDLLLSLAEATSEPSGARALFLRAVEQYDLVLKAQANSVEAINNKAWILHRHLGKDAEALELVQGLLRRVERKTLPGEFFDTLGSIQESVGKAKDAEESYAEGLRKVSDHPVLNYHMGRLLASDRGRVGQAGDFLLKAQAAGDRLPREMAADVDRLLRIAGR